MSAEAPRPSDIRCQGGMTWFRYRRQARMWAPENEWEEEEMVKAAQVRFTLVAQDKIALEWVNPQLCMAPTGEFAREADGLCFVPQGNAEAVRVVLRMFNIYQSVLQTVPWKKMLAATKNTDCKKIVSALYSGTRGVVCAGYAVLIRLWSELAALGLTDPAMNMAALPTLEFAWVLQWAHEMLIANACAHARLDDPAMAENFRDGQWYRDPIEGAHN